MKKTLVGLFMVFLLTACFGSSSSAAIAEFAINFEDNDGNMKLKNYGYYDPGFIGSVGLNKDGSMAMNGYFFRWENDSNLLSLSATVNNPNPGAKNLSLLLFEDIPYQFNINDGKFMGTQTITAGSSEYTWNINNPRNDFWFVLAPEAKGEAFNLTVSDARLNGCASPVPNPATLLTFGSGLLGLIGIKRFSF